MESRQRKLSLWVGVLLLVGGTVHGGTVDHEAFLKEVEEMERFTVPARADVTLETHILGRVSHDHVIQIYRPGSESQVYTEFRSDGAKTLLLGEQEHDYYYDPAVGNVPFAFALDQTFGDTDFTKEDLQELHVDEYRSTLVQATADHIVIEMVSRGKSQYLRRVYTFDPEKKVAVRVEYFRQPGDTPAKVRQDSAQVQVNGKWRPTQVSMEDREKGTRSVLTIRWVEEPRFSPRLFHPQGLATPSGLQWPEGAAS